MYILIVLHIFVIAITVSQTEAQTLPVNTTWSYLRDINDGMTARHMVPNFVEEAPTELCTVIYGKNAEAGVGNVFTPNATIGKPRITWKCQESSYYTLTLTNAEIDYNGDIFTETQHWIVINIPGCQIEKGEEIIKYKSPTIVERDEYYQYVVLIFKQPDKISVQLNHTLSENQTRTSIKIKDFAWLHNLGTAQAGSLFYMFEPIDYDDFQKHLDHKNIQKHLAYWDNV